MNKTNIVSPKTGSPSAPPVRPGQSIISSIRKYEMEECLENLEYIVSKYRIVAFPDKKLNENAYSFYYICSSIILLKYLKLYINL